MTHTAKNVQFDVFINFVMWNRPNARVHAGPMGLCFAWQGACGKTYAAFKRGNNVIIYQAMNASWPVPIFDRRTKSVA